MKCKTNIDYDTVSHFIIKVADKRKFYYGGLAKKWEEKEEGT